MRVVGFVIFAALLIGGLVFFMDYRKKQDAKAEVEAAKYFLSLMAEDPSTVPNPQGGPPVHPWVLISTPTQLEVEEKVPLPRTMDGEWFTWILHYDPAGGNDLKTVNVKAKFDNQGNLGTLVGIHGTVGTSPNIWVPE